MVSIFFGAYRVNEPESLVAVEMEENSASKKQKGTDHGLLDKVPGDGKYFFFGAYRVNEPESFIAVETENSASKKPKGTDHGLLTDTPISPLVQATPLSCVNAEEAIQFSGSPLPFSQSTLSSQSSNASLPSSQWTFGTPSSLPLSQSIFGTQPSSSSLLSSQLTGGNTSGTANHDILHNIKICAEELMGQCRICWFKREVGRPHFTYTCDTGICSGSEYKSFKTQTRFPPGKACYLCYAPYESPFEHPRPPAGKKYTGDQCDFPDILKELAFLIYQDPQTREAVFAKINHATPVTVALYWRFIGALHEGRLLGVYKVIAAYLEIRAAANM